MLYFIIIAVVIITNLSTCLISHLYNKSRENN